jgi:hypothetical protein
MPCPREDNSTLQKWKSGVLANAFTTRSRDRFVEISLFLPSFYYVKEASTPSAPQSIRIEGLFPADRVL